MSRQESEKYIEEARLLLPWYLTNTLSDEEQDLVNRALEASSELRKEFVREEKMMRLVQENTSLLELSALDTTEQRLENTLARIEREDLQLAATANGPLSRPLAAKATSSWFSRLFERKLFDLEWLSPANAVFASLLAVQVGVLGYYQLNADYYDHGSDKFSTVSVGTESPVVIEKTLKQQFLMEFQADAQHSEVCDFLNKWGARIVEGPNSRNVFVVEMPTAPHTNAASFADDIMSKASDSDAPIVFIGQKFNSQ